jgi:hypothetical protein
MLAKCGVLDPFAKLPKVIISFFTSVGPSSVHIKELGAQWTDFGEI